MARLGCRVDSNKEAGSLPEAPESTEDSVPGCHGVYL